MLNPSGEHVSHRRKVVSVLKTVEEVDAELREIVKWVEERASTLLAIADEASREIKAKANQLVEEAVKQLNELYAKEAERLEKKFSEAISREVGKVEEMASTNRERAIEEAARKLLEVIKGGGG